LSGDIDFDNTISVKDVVALQKYLLNKNRITKDQWTLADMNGDRKVNVFDLVLLKKALLNQK